jgi:type II secretory pathway predicted ATPase ExeA
VPLTTERKAHLQSLGLPSDQEMIRRARAFALRAGLTYGELAEMAGFNQNTFRVWMSGNYDRHHQCDSNTLNLRAAVKEVIDRYEIETMASSATPHHSTDEYEKVRRAMWSALRQSTAYLVDGPPGTQKTYAFRRVAEEINASSEGRAVYVYARINHGPQAFLVEACSEAGIPNRGMIDQLVRKLRFFLGSQRALLVVDEAQHLPLSTLEVLRQLLDMPPFFGVVMGGSHDLSVSLRNWQMEQWRSRLRRTLLLNGLTAAEGERILTSELGPLNKRDIAEVIEGASVEAVRNRKPFRYISARNLFFAIEDARVAAGQPIFAPSAQEEAIA